MIKRIQNTVMAGFRIGMLVPAALLAIAWLLIQQFAWNAKADLLLIGCVGLNALLLKYFFKIEKENTGKGVLTATFIWGMLFFIYKIKQS